MDNKTHNYFRRRLVQGMSEVLPNAFMSWIEGINPMTERITVRLSLEASIDIPNERLMFDDTDLDQIGRIAGDKLRAQMGHELRRVLREYYGH